MKHTKLGFIVIAVTMMLLLVACGGGEEPAPAPESGAVPEFQPVVQPITGAEADGLLQVPDANGITPCGVFDVGSQGDRIVDLSQYDNCFPSNPSVHDIACLNDSAQWTKDFVSDLSYGGETVEFVSQQTGICGIFVLE